MNFNDLSNIMSDDIGTLFTSSLGGISVVLMIIIILVFLYGFSVLLRTIAEEFIRRSEERWIELMKESSDKELRRYLGKLRSDPRLPTSFKGAKANTLEDRYTMVNDFMRIIKKRKIKR